MNFLRVALAGLAGFVAYFATGGLMFVMLPSLKKEFAKYPTVYRTGDEINKVMPLGMAFMFLGIIAMAYVYALAYQLGVSPVMQGARFGVAIGIFAIAFFSVHNYVNLKIGGKLTVQASIAYFIEWVITSIAIALVYRPLVG